jgi:formate hydrogenlyase subunit 6/NADH:ubiquinone oxidoreductase subunit I
MATMKMVKIVLGSVFKKPATRLYPFVKREPYAVTRGHIDIKIDQCTFCSLCQRKCPTAAITVNRNEKKWNIDRFRCIQCGACADACPKKCLSMGNAYTSPALVKSTETFEQKQPIAVS